MHIFNSQHTITEIIEHDSNLLHVINRFGIRLGLGNITVSQACNSNHVETDFFLTILNVYHNEAYFPEQLFETFNSADIINYLIESHKYYINSVLPNIENTLKILIKNNPNHKDIFILIEKIFSSFINDYKIHIDNEEKNIFPLIEKLSNAKETTILVTQLSSLHLENTHSILDDKIIDLKNILVKYLPPINDTQLYNAFACAIITFEKDLKNHSRIEDRILFPKIQDALNSLNHKHKQSQSHDLTTREIEILKLIAHGYSNKEIATTLFISTHTVITHRKNLSEKLSIKTISGLTMYAVIKKLITISDINTNNLK